MKKMFSLSFRSVSRHIGMSLLIMLQVTILCIGVNVLIASRNQQKTLIQPYSELLEKEGYYLSFQETSLFGSDKIDVVESLSGEWEITSINRYVFNANEGGKTIPCTAIIYPNDFWDSYAPSIKHGKKPKSSKTNDSPWCIASANYNGDSVVIPGSNKKIKIKGMLADKCYIPSMDTWERNGSLKENLYTTFNLSQSDTAFFLMPQSQWDALNIGNEGLVNVGHCIAVLKSKLTEEQRAANEKLFQNAAYPQLELSVLKERAYKDLEKNNRRFLPLLIAQVIITIFGIICATAIQAMRDVTITSIYKLCGMNKKHGIYLAIGNSAILLGISTGWIIITYFITLLAGTHAKYGLRFGANNICITLLIMIILLLSSVITNRIVSKKSDFSLELRRQ